MSEFLYILGVPNFANYEATAALIRVPRTGGDIAYVTVAEERLTREKHGYGFPLRGIHYCLTAFGLEALEQVDFIYTDYARVPRWMNSGPGYRKLEHDYLKRRLSYPIERIRVVDHHDAHAASAFYLSPFDEAAVLVVDALGSRLNTQTIYHAAGRRLHAVERGNHWGVGRIYALVTGSVLPYGPEKGFGKTMGLAPYGRLHPGPVLHFGAHDEGMTTDYSAFCTRAPLPHIVADGVRKCDDRERVLDPYFARAAYDAQVECERQMLRMARYAHERTGSRRLCLAGGVALNGLANAGIVEHGPFDDVWIPPGCSDTGLSLGLALWGYFQDLAASERAPARVSMATAYTGRPYTAGEVTATLDRFGIDYTSATPEDVAEAIARGKVVAWFEGGSEFGPRALGHRSILADPRDPDVKDTLNRRVKFREGYRPYAPSILAEHASEWLELSSDSPFMLLVVKVREDKRPIIPGVTHVDDTTRPQTVTEAANPNYYRLIKAFHRLTGVPMVLNTSFNVNREPIVETPIDALVCGLGTSIDLLYMDGWLVDCQRHASPELLKRLTAERARTLEAEWKTVTAKYLTRYDPRERDAWLAEENKIAEWHRLYRSKYELEKQVETWTAAGTSVLIVGTRGHTRCLRRYIDGFAGLAVAGFVGLDDHPGEAGELDVYPDTTLSDVDWTGIDAVLISTHEYQALAEDLARRAAPAGIDIFTMYDDAGESLLYVLPGQWIASTDTPAEGGAVPVSSAGRVVVDFESPHASPVPVERYALIVNYHYCHPADDPLLGGTNGITPAEFDRQLRVLRQNFVCTTIGELMNPRADLPETVAVVTFDDGFRDVVEHALPVLQRWGVPATVYCCSAPLLDRRVLDVHRAHLLQARLGMNRFRDEFERALDAVPAVGEPSDVPLVLENLYPHDVPEMRRFKRLLNYELPYATLGWVLHQLFERFIGREVDVAPKVYLSPDDIRRCQDAGLDIGIHGHEHRVLSRLTPEAQQHDIGTAADYFSRELGVRERHFSYPYGVAGTWTDATEGILDALGFASSVAVRRTIVKPQDIAARWRLPRFDVRDVFDAGGELISAPLMALFTAD